MKSLVNIPERYLSYWGMFRIVVYSVPPWWCIEFYNRMNTCSTRILLNT